MGQENLELETRFTYHRPKAGQAEIYVEIRDFAKAFAYLLDAKVPDSREKSLAFTALEETIFWANAGIARRS